MRSVRKWPRVRTTLTACYPLVTATDFACDDVLEKAVARRADFGGSDGETRDLGWHFDDALAAERTATKLRALGFKVTTRGGAEKGEKSDV